MISITYQTMCISIVVILIVGIIIGSSLGGSSKESAKEREERRIWAEVSEKELKQLGKYKQGDESKQTPDFMEPKFPRDINLDDFLKNDDFTKRTKGKDK